jgi:hypothetical protein
VNGPSDEHDEMTDHVGVPSAPATGDQSEQDEVARFLVELRMLGEGAPPAPSPELAALLGGAVALEPRRRRPHYRVALRSAVVAAAVVSALVVAAANHDLPQPAQRVVSNVVNVLTPFQIGPDNRGTLTPTFTPQPARPAAPPGDDSSGPGEDRPGGDGTRSRGSDDGAGGGGADDGAASGDAGGSAGGPGSEGGGSDGAATSAPGTGGSGGVESGDATSAPPTGAESADR